jgi:hypothetical protein
MPRYQPGEETTVVVVVDSPVVDSLEEAKRELAVS